MFIEFVALGTGAVAMLTGVSAGAVAALGRRPVEEEQPEVPRMAVITQETLDALPLVAPDRAGYGTASRLLLQTAAMQRPTNISKAPDHRKAA